MFWSWRGAAVFAVRFCPVSLVLACAGLVVLPVVWGGSAAAQTDPKEGPALRALENVRQDVADANAAIRKCDYIAWDRARKKYLSDRRDYLIRKEGAGTFQMSPNTPDFPFPYPENCIPTPTVYEQLQQFQKGFYWGGGAGGTTTAGSWIEKKPVTLGSDDPNIDPAKQLRATNAAVEVLLGYFWDLGVPGWVAAVEAQAAYFHALMDPGIPGTGAIGSAAVRANDSVTVRAQGSAMLRGRIGYLVTQSTLLYVAAGPSSLSVRATVNCTLAGVCGTNGIAPLLQTNSSTRLGWTLGGGVEKVLWGNLRARVEYRYADYGTWSTSFGTPAQISLSPDIKLHTHSTMVGLVYQFGSPASPAPAVDMPVKAPRAK